MRFVFCAFREFSWVFYLWRIHDKPRVFSVDNTSVLYCVCSNINQFKSCFNKKYMMRIIRVEKGLLKGAMFDAVEVGAHLSCLNNPSAERSFPVIGENRVVRSEITEGIGLLAGKNFDTEAISQPFSQMDCIAISSAFTVGFSLGFKS